MSQNARGVRDGTGSYKGSYQRKVSKVGKRQAQGQKCPKRLKPC